MFDPLIHSGLVFIYAALGLAVAVWRLCKVLVASIAAGVLAVIWEREGDRAGHYQPEEESDERIDFDDNRRTGPGCGACG